MYKNKFVNEIQDDEALQRRDLDQGGGCEGLEKWGRDGGTESDLVKCF